MALTICVLASGSSANCIYVGSEQTSILVDAGLSGKETERRLETIGVPLDRIHAICLTHEHDDHRAALGILHRRVGASLYANSGTIEAIEREQKDKPLPWQVFTTGAAFGIGDLRLEPFSVPHDSYDPVGFIISWGVTRVGVVTDMGMATTLTRQRLRNCHALVVEANHDEDLLKDADRPWALKQRILGSQGHLSNRQAAELLTEVAWPELRAVFLAHLSAECNKPDLAVRTIRQALDQSGHAHVDIKLTYADRPSEVVRLQ
jgi:phosphoribosyl 1,2-cyclic phosphodiesterase